MFYQRRIIGIYLKTDLELPGIKAKLNHPYTLRKREIQTTPADIRDQTCYGYPSGLVFYVYSC